MLYTYRCWLLLFFYLAILLVPFVMSYTFKVPIKAFLVYWREEWGDKQGAKSGIMGLGGTCTGYLEGGDDPSLPWKPAMLLGLWSCLSQRVCVPWLYTSPLVFAWIFFQSWPKGQLFNSKFYLQFFHTPSSPLFLSGAQYHLSLLSNVKTCSHLCFLKGIWLLRVGV